MYRFFRFALTILICTCTPLAAFAHGGVDDGHVDASGHAAGASALLQAGSVAWFGLLFVSVFITGVLSLIVWKYLQVPAIIKKQETKNSSASSVKQ